MEESNISASSKKKKRILIGTIITIIIIVILLIYLLSPSLSPISSIRDTDDDGHPDASDAFPTIASQWSDIDNDKFGDNPNGTTPDKFPSDPTQWFDSDLDGYGDNQTGTSPDAFPWDPLEWADTDSDGIGDNADFYDQGNGKVLISITSYQEDGTADFWTYGDPRFDIMIDINADDIADYSYSSQVFVDTAFLNNPFSVTIDLPDQTAFFKFTIWVWDSDLSDVWQIIDYSPNVTETHYTHTVNAPFSQMWAYNGNSDGLNEIDCALSYSISVIS